MPEGENKASAALSIKPEDIQVLAEMLAELGKKIAPIVRDVSAKVRDFCNEHQEVFQEIGSVVIKLGEQFHVYTEFNKNCKKHDIVPHELLYPLLQRNPAFFLKSHNEQSIYLAKTWPEISKKLLDSYSVFEAAGIRFSFFKEILTAHELGLYKVSMRSAIIEIEGLSSDYCKRFESVDNVKRRREVINKWEAKIHGSDQAYVRWCFVLVAFENYIGNVFLSTGALGNAPDVSERDILLSRNFHAHGFVSEISERQSMNAILLLHNIAHYFANLSEVSTE